MARLKILANGKLAQDRARGRGKLFEQLMTDVLRHYGFSIDRIASVNYAGMEIDIEGKHSITAVPIYVECKCYETEVDAPKLQAFFGKYMTFWLTNNLSQGLFIALPGVNTHAKGLYKANWQKCADISVRLLEEDAVLEAIFAAGSASRPEHVAQLIRSEGSPGDQTLLYTDKGLFWIQYVVPPGSGISRGVSFFDAAGNSILDKATVDYLVLLYPELAAFDVIVPGKPATLTSTIATADDEEIVEVRGSSACFEYQFPASPQYFVGRETILEDLDTFVIDVLAKATSARGILFEANSGWGKSSVVLASVSRLRQQGHFAVAIDSRSASSSLFMLKAVEHTLKNVHGFPGPLFGQASAPPITGFEGAINTLLGLRESLEARGRIVFIFLDQFENVFFQMDVLKRIRDLFLRICDAQTNLVLGFSWKTDLIGLTSEFPYQLRDALAGSSKRISLETFSEPETTTLLDKLAEELHSKLRKDLRFFLSEFSQGYPWLLKKLCAHVKGQREAGVPQSEIANSLLNVEELFQEDLRGLTAEQEEALRRISRTAPISILEVGEEFKPEVVQSLVNARLVVRIGSKYDIYWDIFRDYLNSGKVPVQENYILRVQTGSLRKAMELLIAAGGTLAIPALQDKAELSEKTLQNVIKDMRLLGLALVENGAVLLQVSSEGDGKTFGESLRDYLSERLPRNRLVSRLTEALELFEKLSLDEIAELLAEWCPYISATGETWKTYARIFADWMDIADLAVFDYKLGELARYKAGTEIRERRILPSKRRGGMVHPIIQYSPIEEAAIRIGKALKTENRVLDWAGFKKSTLAKALASLEDLGFIVRKSTTIEVQPKGMEFINNPGKRSSLFAESAMKMQSFRTFIEHLQENSETAQTYVQLADQLREKLGVAWTDGTAKVNAKIMLDWARHSKLAPGVFAESLRSITRRQR